MARAGAKQLIEAEDALEIALSKMMSLGSELTRMRVESRLSMTTGQQAMTRLTRAIQRAAKVRKDMILVHESLDDVKTRIGCGATAVGDLNKPEKDPDTPSGSLRVVQDQRAA